MGSKKEEVWNYVFKVKKNTEKAILEEINDWLKYSIKGTFTRSNGTIFMSSLDDAYKFKIYFFYDVECIKSKDSF